MKRFLLITLVLLFALSVNAQYKAGIKYYERLDYYKAIEKLKKVKPGKPERIDALVKIADSYRMLRQFNEAANYYKQSMEAGNNDPQAHYHYGLTLKSLNRYDEALRELNLYLAASPSDSKAKNAVKSCTEMKAALKLPLEYITINLASVNTKYSEYCPFVFDKGLAYVSYQKNDWVNIDRFGDDGVPFTTVYYASLLSDTMLKGQKNFSAKINSDFHDGPLCLTADLSAAYFTRVNYVRKKKEPAFVNQPKIYYSVKSGNSWQKAIAFPHNSDDYAVAHPTVSADGNSLFFSSNMPGGQGGMDLWVSRKNGDSWDKPVNLGPDINTSGNEEFPYLRNDGILFFSSDGLPGFGGLDIFSATQIAGKWILNKNEGQGLNSFADDFGVYFIDKTKGYVSSNRDGGKGSDDIYFFTYKASNINIEGFVIQNKSSNNPAVNAKLLLKDESGQVLNQTSTDNRGYFKFENQKAGKKYEVVIDESGITNTSKIKKFYYADVNRKLQRNTVVNSQGDKYAFVNLPADPNALPEITSDDFSISGSLLYGQNPSSPIPNAHILLKNESDVLVDETTTNFFGSFAFTNISPEIDYSIEVEPPLGMKLPLNTRLVLTNKNGMEIRVLRADKSGKYKFNKLASEKTNLNDMKVSDSDLFMDLSGKILDPDKKKLPGAKVSVLNDKGDTLQSNLTDASGSFKFYKLPAVKDYTLTVDGNTGAAKNYEKIYLADGNEKIVQALIKDFKNGFQYKILKSEHPTIKQIYQDDPWLDVLNLSGSEKTIQENVYYASGEYKLSAAGMNILDKVILVLKSNLNIQIEIGSHTDSRGNDDFNLALSKKRANAGAEYLINHGINAGRVKGLGYGESKLKNHCGNGVTCSDEEHAKNRRTEFRIINKK